LRSQSRPGHRKTFFAVCIEMVLHRAGGHVRSGSAQAVAIVPQSKPCCRQNPASSPVIAARIKCAEIWSSERQL